MNVTSYLVILQEQRHCVICMTQQLNAKIPPKRSKSVMSSGSRDTILFWKVLHVARRNHSIVELLAKMSL